MNSCCGILTLLIDLDNRSIPVQIEYVQTVAPGGTTYDLLDVSLDIPTLRTMSIRQAEYVTQHARAHFLAHLHRQVRP